MNRFCNKCNIEKDEINYLKKTTVCKSCYNRNRRRNNNHTLIQNQQRKIDKTIQRKLIIKVVLKKNHVIGT